MNVFTFLFSHLENNSQRKINSVFSQRMFFLYIEIGILHIAVHVFAMHFVDLIQQTLQIFFQASSYINTKS